MCLDLEASVWSVTIPAVHQLSYSPCSQVHTVSISKLIIGLSQIGAIVTSLGLSTGPYVDESIRGSVAGAYSLTGIPSLYHLTIGGCGILLLTKLGGFLFDRWTAGAPFYIMALLNIVALLAAAAVILVERSTPKIRLPDDDEDPLLPDEIDAACYPAVIPDRQRE